MRGCYLHLFLNLSLSLPNLNLDLFHLLFMPAFLLFVAGFVFNGRVGIRLLYFFMHLVAPFLFNRCFDFLLSFVGYIGFFMGHLDLGFL